MSFVVAGLGVRSTFGIGPQVLLQGLCAGQPAYAPYAPFAAAGMRLPFAAAVPDAAFEGTASWPDRATRLLEGAVRDALADCGVDGLSALAARFGVPKHRLALVAGTSSSGIGPFSEVVASGASRGDAHYGSAARDVARALGHEGPLLVVCNVCASGAIAVAEAAALLDEDRCDVAIAVGYDALAPFVGVGFASLNALTDRPRPFRAGRTGLVLGEGAAALVLARRSIGPSRGRVTGWGISADAHHLTAPDPSGAGVALAIHRALERAGRTPADVGVINLHGTGTLFNDAMESAALARVFGPGAGGVPAFTVKGTIGHAMGAGGAIEAVVSFAAMAARVVPPTVTSGEPDPACDVALVTGAPLPCDATVTLSLSSAFGGSNCALVLEGAI